MKKRLITTFLLILTVLDVGIRLALAVLKDHHIPTSVDDAPETAITRYRERFLQVNLASTVTFSEHLTIELIHADGTVEHREV